LGRPGGIFRANSDEHNEDGYSDEEADNTAKMIEKRMRKQALADREDATAPMIYGEKNADVTLVGWGSTKGAGIEAVARLKEQNVNANYVQITHLNPFPTDAVETILKSAKKVVDVEGNHNGQMAEYIRMKTGIYIKDRILKYDGRPFYPEDIIEKLKKII
jgi:2-oxoglutarate ferredoxin oxidoreductase subunit alpha